MSLHIRNTSCYQGDPGNPPEIESDNLGECIHCGAVIDLDEEIYDCPGCGYAQSDESTEEDEVEQ